MTRRKYQSPPYGSADTVKEPDRGYHPTRRGPRVSEMVMFGNIDDKCSIIIITHRGIF